MTKTTLWHPDTCQCAVRYSWDTSDQNIPYFDFRMEETCPRHFMIEDAADAYEAIKAENIKKNVVLNSIADLHDDLKVSSTDDEGNVSTSPNTKAILMSYSEDGVLHVAFDGVSQEVKEIVIDLSAGIRQEYGFIID
jgi:hypothetical protein